MRGRERRSGIAGQATLLGVGYLLRSAGSFGLTVMLGRELGAAGLGSVSVFLAVTWGLYYVTASWVLVSVPALSGGREDSLVDPDRLWAAMAVALGSTAVALLVVEAVAVTFADDLPGSVPSAALPALALCVLAVLILNALYAVLQTVGRAGSVAALQLADRVVAFAAVGIAVGLADGGRTAAIWAIAAAAAVTALAGLAFAGVGGQLGRPVLRRPALRRVTSFSVPIAVTNVAAYVVGWADVLILAVVLDARAVGVYAVAYQFFTLLVGVASGWITAAIPAYAQRGVGAGGRLALGPVRFAAGAWSALVGAVGTVAVPLIRPVFGEQFGRSAGVAALLLAAAALLAPYYAVVPVLIAQGRVRRLMWISVASAAVNVVIDLALVQSVGIWAAAIGTLAQTVVCVVLIVREEWGTAALGRVATACVPGALPLALLSAWPREPLAVWAAAGLVLAAVGIALRRLGSSSMRGVTGDADSTAQWPAARR